MRNFFFTFVISLVLTGYSCSSQPNKSLKTEIIETVFTVEDVTKNKYSKVYGSIIHNGFKVKIDNGNSGYYYKEYNLSSGDKIKTKILVHYISTYYGYELSFGDIDVSQYEK